MTFIEPRIVPPEEFPESSARTAGMAVLEANLTPIHATALLDVVYAEKSGRRLRLQVILPPGVDATPPDGDETGAGGAYPCLLYVQGSAWREQALGQNLPALADFARRGYVIAIVEYRPSDLAPFPAQVADVKTAIRYVRAHAAELHVDPGKIGLWGDSSGGHTTLMTYATQDSQDYSDEPVGPGLDGGLGLRCFIDYYGPTDISRMNEEPSIQDHRSPGSPEGMLIGGHDVLDHPELVGPTVVASHVPDAADRRLQPLLVIHGSKDRIVPFAQSAQFCEKLAAAGQDVTFYQLRGADHAGPPFWQPEVLDIVDAFAMESFR
ncbi:alpha/beta hydrolase fold domain-containing protein [Schaalia naturae]|jgi:acetyl esterase/lipase|uniref:Alpha/beta hydrolase fold domain-containing protein n=1 Tax=Schaalia naturae TaxID=635203 RepID=A0ABW2SME9_9ACTO